MPALAVFEARTPVSFCRESFAERLGIAMTPVAVDLHVQGGGILEFVASCEMKINITGHELNQRLLVVEDYVFDADVVIGTDIMRLLPGVCINYGDCYVEVGGTQLHFLDRLVEDDFAWFLEAFEEEQLEWLLETFSLLPVRAFE
ncbi:hypothetical protein QR680_002870 [Steinernema hermaphroditum]|uniref:Uncharacterized protein n=1 Tax=Steinernema hermaphroditum TaxID=289476 RepID=A0AA39H4D3_9BILA|nr:hypothetical protein QR680_002870 [Steinernema hermaphroditum]